jgi:hypothetical protein
VAFQVPEQDHFAFASDSTTFSNIGRNEVTILELGLTIGGYRCHNPSLCTTNDSFWVLLVQAMRERVPLTVNSTCTASTALPLILYPITLYHSFHTGSVSSARDRRKLAYGLFVRAKSNALLTLVLWLMHWRSQDTFKTVDSCPRRLTSWLECHKAQLVACRLNR